MKTDVDKEEEQAPNEPWANLCFILEKFCIISGENREQAAKEFLMAGEKVDLPRVMDKNGEKTPYRLFPMACYSVINSCVKLLERDLEMEINGGTPDEETERTAVGAMCLADMLFAGACTSPDGKFSIHWVRIDKGEIALNPHGRRIKQLAARLGKYRTARLELAEKAGKELSLPSLSCKTTVEQDIQMSLSQWGMIDPRNWDGRAPWEITDSVESMKENLGVEAIAYDTPIGSLGSEFEDRAAIHDDVIAQRAWLDLPVGSIPENLRYHETQRGNILAQTPKAWIWSYAEDPLEFAVDYMCSNAKPCLEEAHGLLTKAQEDPRFEEAGSLALVFDSQSKNNPDSYWKLIKRVAGHFSSSRGPDPEAVLRKLDCARFTVCLEMTNRRLGVDPDEFQRIFQEKIHKILGDPKRRETVTRNELLLETLGETKAAKDKNWGAPDLEIWLEHLQTSAVGAYENSVGMEAERKRLLGMINHLFKTPREELEEAKRSGVGQEEVAVKLHGILTSATNAFYEYLSGKTGQMTRRELRTKVYAMKKSAEDRGKADLAQRLGTTGKFLSSISGQIKSGEWYSNKAANKEAIFNFLATMLECPKSGPVEFPGSKEPEPKDPLEITCDFLKAIGINSPMGGGMIASAMADFEEYESSKEGGQLLAALKKITKGKTEKEDERGPKQTLTGMIGERKRTLEEAIEISESIHTAKDPLRELHQKMEEAAEILRAPQRLDSEENEKFEKNLYFWKGLHYLTQNIQSRKEDERYQVSATGKGTLQNLIAMAKAKLKNKDIRRKDGGTLQQFGLTKTRERSLLSNVAVPLALWLEKDTKGTKTKITHEEFVGGLKDRLKACEVCLQISEDDQDMEKKTEEFKTAHKKARVMTNSFLIADAIGALEEPKELAAGLAWEMKEPKASAKLAEYRPDLDTPTKRWAHAQSTRQQTIKPQMAMGA